MKMYVDEDGEIVFEDVFNAFGVKTSEDGVYGICQRDGGLEIVQRGVTVWNSMHDRNSAGDIGYLETWINENLPDYPRGDEESTVETVIRVMQQWLDERRACKAAPGE